MQEENVHFEKLCDFLTLVIIGFGSTCLMKHHTSDPFTRPRERRSDQTHRAKCGAASPSSLVPGLKTIWTFPFTSGRLWFICRARLALFVHSSSPPFVCNFEVGCFFLPSYLKKKKKNSISLCLLTLSRQFRFCRRGFYMQMNECQIVCIHL